MNTYPVLVQVNAEQLARLNFLALRRQSSRSAVAYNLFATALADAVIADADARAAYEAWRSLDQPAGGAP